MLKPVTPVFAKAGLEIPAVPVFTVQSPVPIAGTFPESVAEDAQSV